MTDTAISAGTRAELEGVIMLLLSDIRGYRERRQKSLSDPTLTISELMRNMGEVTALKSVEELIGRLSEIYGIEL